MQTVMNGERLGTFEPGRNNTLTEKHCTVAILRTVYQVHHEHLRPSIVIGRFITVSECFMAFSEVLQTVKNVNRTVNGCNAFEPELNDENFHLYVHGLLKFKMGILF